MRTRASCPQPTRPADLFVTILQAMYAQVPFNRQDLLEKLRQLEVQSPYQVIHDALACDVLVHHPYGPGPQDYHLCLGPVTLYPAPPFFEVLRRYAAGEDEAAEPAAQSTPAGPAAARPRATMPTLWHPKTTGVFSYYRAGQDRPYKDISLPQFFGLVTGTATSKLAKLTAAARALVGTKGYYEQVAAWHDTVTFGARWWPEWPGSVQSGLLVLTVELDPARTTRARAQALLCADEFLRDALLLLYADPAERTLTLVVAQPVALEDDYDPEIDFHYDGRWHPYQNHVNIRYRDEGLSCVQRSAGPSETERCYVWHDPLAFIHARLLALVTRPLALAAGPAEMPPADEAEAA